MGRICLLGREHVSAGGGIGVSVPALAEVLAAEHEVTLVTPEPPNGRPEPASRVRRVFVQEPTDWRLEGFACDQHAYSAAVLASLEDAYGDGPGPDLLEAPDYRAESFVPLQAARSGHELLARTTFCVRLRGTLELALLHDDFWPEQEELLAVFAMEREVLARSDRILHAGGDTHSACARYYDRLAPASLVRLPLPPLPLPPTHVPRPAGGPLRLLYAGRLERRKGVLELVEAVLSLPGAQVRLTIVGADQRGAPLGRSMRTTLGVMAAGDDRIEFHDRCSRVELQSLMAQADVAVLPSRFEWWANVACEAMHAGLPILATPVGGFTEQVAPGETGWLTRGTDARSLATEIARLADEPAAADAVRASGAPQRRLAELTRSEEVLRGYRELLDTVSRPRVAQPNAGTTRVTAVIPAHDAGEFVFDALESFLDQAGDGGDAIVVDDGSSSASFQALEPLRAKPRVRVLHQRHRGAAAARNMGIEQAEGEYVLMLDADDVLEPGALRRMLTALAEDVSLGYAVPWYRMEPVGGEADSTRQTAWCPLGAGLELIVDRNVVGGTCTLFRREIFSKLGYRYAETNVFNDDRELLESLTRDGRPGAVVPDVLLRRRVLPSGLTAAVRDYGEIGRSEMRARLRARETRWTAPIA